MQAETPFTCLRAPLDPAQNLKVIKLTDNAALGRVTQPAKFNGLQKGVIITPQSVLSIHNSKANLTV